LVVERSHILRIQSRSKELQIGQLGIEEPAWGQVSTPAEGDAAKKVDGATAGGLERGKGDAMEVRAAEGSGEGQGSKQVSKDEDVRLPLLGSHNPGDNLGSIMVWSGSNSGCSSSKGRSSRRSKSNTYGALAAAANSSSSSSHSWGITIMLNITIMINITIRT